MTMRLTTANIDIDELGVVRCWWWGCFFYCRVQLLSLSTVSVDVMSVNIGLWLNIIIGFVLVLMLKLRFFRNQSIRRKAAINSFGYIIYNTITIHTTLPAHTRIEYYWWEIQVSVCIRGTYLSFGHLFLY